MPMKFNGDFSSDGAKVLISETIRLYVGHGRRLSFKDVAEATDMKEGTVRSYVAEDGPLMPLDVFMRVFTVLPPAAFARVARQMGFAAAPAETADDGTVRKALTKAAQLVAEGNEILEDGVITPSERARLAQRAGEFLPMLQTMAGGGTPH